MAAELAVAKAWDEAKAEAGAWARAGIACAQTVERGFPMSEVSHALM